MHPDLKLYPYLECPECGKICRPVDVKNRKCYYEKHSCEAEDNYQFAIDEEGNLVE